MTWALWYLGAIALTFAGWCLGRLRRKPGAAEMQQVRAFILGDMLSRSRVGWRPRWREVERQGPSA